MDRSDKIKKIESAIEKMAKELIKKPYVYIYEGDVQARLYCLIREEFGDKFGLTTGNIETTLIHTQLPMIGFPHRHFDIAIWDAEIKCAKEEFRKQPVEIGIEIKYNLKGEFGKISPKYKFIKLYLDDLRKLVNFKMKNEKFIGYALWFLPIMDDENFTKEGIEKFIKEKINNTNEIYSWVMLKNKSLKYSKDNKMGANFCHIL